MTNGARMGEWENGRAAAHLKGHYIQDEALPKISSENCAKKKRCGNELQNFLVMSRLYAMVQLSPHLGLVSVYHVLSICSRIFCA